ncbi:hypothetical protein BOSEA31B_12446 [Hyphomicrobiales bacterium]|nr:hypothetical protein BOSEA31B_12446 [Hyphomicrobiales bacterium]CAH1698225.1 hypothetical protein BOSEA1005_11270 [Hyphomicrobiales bacterium]CAI0347869.1 hypothetical protein BO1005MUT1_90230 [Hyphomicrobiales bacterium]
MSTGMGSNVDNPGFAGAPGARLYNPPRPSTAPILCMVKEVFHVNHFAVPEGSTDSDPLTKP